MIKSILFFAFSLCCCLQCSQRSWVKGNLCSQDLLLDEVLRYSFPEVCRVPETNIYVDIMDLGAQAPDDIKIMVFFIGFHFNLLTQSFIQ